MDILTYSERGLVDSLVYSLTNDKLVKDFLVLGFKELETKSLSEIKLYLEHSLSDFGSPDLIITFLEAGKKTVIFVEAKVSNGKKNWKLSTQYDYYCKKETKDITSNFFRQIALKNELISNSETSVKQGLKCEDDRVRGAKEFRKLGENKIVLKLYDSIKNANQFKYLGLVPESSIPEFLEEDKKIFSKIKYITWKQIEEFANKNNLRYLKENFEWNKGLIYNDDNE